jgi:hypothetical protein
VARTPDRFPGEREDEGLLLEPDTVAPIVNGELRYVTGVGFRFFEEGVEKGLTGTGISASQHQALRQLIHFLDDGPANGFPSGSYKETLPAASPFPTSEIWWESSAKLKKIVSLDTTWTGAKITQEVWEVYDIDGSTVLATVTDVISYVGVFETSRTRTIA